MDNLSIYKSVLTCPPCTGSVYYHAHDQYLLNILLELWWTVYDKNGRKVQPHISSPALPTAAYTAEQRKERKTELKKATKKGVKQHKK